MAEPMISSNSPIFVGDLGHLKVWMLVALETR